jgi:hypothetical protein
MRNICVIAMVSCVAALSGCTGVPVTTTAANPASPAHGAALKGRVHGGQQPIIGASVYLYAVDTTGYGKASDSLLNGPGYVTTGSDGSFSITGDYTCPTASSQVYLYAVGGNTGAGTNSSIGLLAGLGSCGSLNSATFVFMNEVSTIATAYSIAGYATDATHVSSSSTPLAATGVANAFATIPNLETLSTGVALSMSPGGFAHPAQSTINTLANILAACINSSGPSSTPCTTLLSNALSGGATGTQPTDTSTAAINIAHNPAYNIANLFALQTGAPPFLPDLSGAPNDFTLQIAFPGPGNWGFYNSLAIDGSGNVWVVGGFSPAGNGFGELLARTLTWSSFTPITGGGLSNGNPVDITIDPSENVWTNINPCNGCSNNLVEVNSSGTILSGAGGYDSSGESNYADIPGNALASDGSGNIFIAADFNSNIFEYIPGTGYSNPGGYGGGGLHGPNMLAVDTSGNVWAANGSDGLSEIDPAGSGSDVSPSSGYTGGGLYSGVALAIDKSGNVWIANNGLGPTIVSEFNSSGTPISTSAGYNTSSYPSYIAVDGANNVWVTTGGFFIEFTNSGAMLPTTNGFGYNTDLGGTGAIAVDGSGNVWTCNPGSYDYITEFVGVAAPVVTPLAANLTAPYGSHTANQP